MIPEEEKEEALRRQLEQAIAVQESMRGTVDDAIIDATIAALHRQLETLQPAQPVEQQRKMVTILFSDVVNSTRLLRELDPEENLEIMDTSLKRMGTEIESRGGRVTRYMGDGFLAVFGLDLARENDPEMAVRAGLALIEAAARIAADLKSSGRYPEFRVRVGINTGQVVAGGATEAEATLSGAAVNLAARLESAAAPNSVLVSGYTQSQVRGIFDLEPQAPIDAKGFPQPVPVFRVLRAKPRAFRLLNRGIEGIDTSLVGREPEMNHLQQTYHEVLARHSARFITITADAGLGKSRLLDEFETWIDLQPAAITLFKGRAAFERKGLPHALLRDLFAFRFEIPDGTPTRDAREKISAGIRQTLGETSGSDAPTALLGQLLGYDFSSHPDIRSLVNSPQQLHDRGFVQLVDFFRKVSAAGPVAVFMDDVHWADESSLEIIRSLYSELEASPVLFVALARPSLFEDRQSWVSSPGHSALVLQPLRREDSTRLLSEILQRVREMPDALRDVIIGNAEGNPFYLEELVKMFLEDGVILKGDRVWKVQPERLIQMKIPPTLTGVIQARMESLPDAERTILQQASVIGRVFWDEAVCAIQLKRAGAPSRSKAYVQGVLDEIRKREIIFRRETSSFPGLREFVFRNSIFRDVVYESVLLRDRKAYHGRAAEWLIEKSGEQAVDASGLIAGQLELAGRDREAFDYLVRAARAALANYANDEAGEFYRRALSACPHEDMETRFDLLLGLEQITAAKGDRPAQQEIHVQLRTLAASLSDPKPEIRVLLREGWFLFWTSDFQRMRMTALRARKLAEKINDPFLVQQSYYVETWAHHMIGEQEQAEKLATIALRIAREHNFRAGEGNTLNILGLIAVSRGDRYEALEYARGFLEITRELKIDERTVTALSNLSVIFTTLGQYEAAADAIRSSIELARDSGDRSAESTSRVNYGWVLQSMEEWELAREILEPAVESKARIGHKEAEAEGLTWLGYTWMGLGNDPKALSHFERALDIRRELEQEVQEVEALSAYALALTKTGNLSLARMSVDQILVYLAEEGELSGTWEPLRIYWNAVQVLRSLQDDRYHQVLKSGYRILQAWAQRIPDPEYRDSFLQNIPWHRELAARWRQENAPGVSEGGEAP